MQKPSFVSCQSILIISPFRFWNAEVEPLPFRLLDDFEVASAANAGELKGLEALGQERKAGGGLVISGAIIDLDDPASKKRISGETIIDWLAEYSMTEAAIWAVTADAWYKLLKPSERYSSFYQFAQHGVALTRLAKLELNTEPDAATDLPGLIDKVSPLPCGEELKSFAILQMEAKLGLRRPRKGHKRRRISGFSASASSGKRSRSSLQRPYSRSRLGLDVMGDEVSILVGDEIDAISDDDMPEDFKISEDEEGDSNALSRARSRAWKKIKYWNRRTLQEERARAAEAAMLEREAKQHEARGDPPQPSRRFCVPQELIPDLLMVWEFTQAFGDILQLPPFSFEALEAAIDPGPRVRAHEALCVPSDGSDADELWGLTETVAKSKDEDERKPLLSTNNGKGLDGTTEETRSRTLMMESKDGNDPIQRVENGRDRNDDNEKDVCANAVGENSSYVKTEPELEGERTVTKKQGNVDNPEEGLKPTTQAQDSSHLPSTNDSDAIKTEMPSGEKAEAIDTPATMGRGRGRGRRGRPPGRGRGRKVAPQNLIIDPTVRTRRQRGSEGEAYREITEEERQLLQRHFVNSDNGMPGGGSSMAAALKAHQERQEAFLAMLKNKYNLLPSAVPMLNPLDRDFAASGVLLRDIVCSLSRAAFNTLGFSEGVPPGTPLQQPVAAQIASADNDALPTWPERLANTVWSIPGASEEARMAALKLAYGDYLDLDPGDRVRLLGALVHAALNSDAMMNEISIRVDAMGMTWCRRDGGAADEQEDEDGKFAISVRRAVSVPVSTPVPAVLAAGPDGTIAPPPPPPPTPSPIDLWKRWMIAQHLGLRRKLGIDFAGRRYWALGRAAGAFRIYVEDVTNDSWGFYEDKDIYELADWVGKASIRQEANLLASLRNAPLPASMPAAVPLPQQSSSHAQPVQIISLSALTAQHYLNKSDHGANRTPDTGPSAEDSSLNNEDRAMPKVLAGKELMALRPDGYRGVALPLLRGEWNWPRRNDSGPPPVEMRVPLAIDDVLSAIPYWFKGASVVKHVLAIADAAATASTPRDASRALLAAEALLCKEEKLTEEWMDLWRSPWRRIVAALTDMKDVGLCVASLQCHVVHPDGLSRRPFMKIAEETRCTAPLPSPGDDVILLRSGLLQHIDRCMQVVGVRAVAAGGEIDAEATRRKDDAMDVDGLREESKDVLSSEIGVSTRHRADASSNEELDGRDSLTDNEGGEYRDEGGPTTAATMQRNLNVEYLPAPLLEEEARSRVESEWEALRSHVASLQPLERYVVRSVVFCRHLAPSEDLSQDEASAMAPRCPVGWICLRPSRQAPRSQLSSADVIVPLAAIPGMPEYLLRTETFVERARISWRPGDRFRMFFGGKISSKTQRKLKAGGTWHKGEIVDVTSTRPEPGAPSEAFDSYDPWESIVVQWDTSPLGETTLVNPWEIEVDPEVETKRAEDARRQQQAHARAARARASNRLPADHPDAVDQEAAWKAEDDKLAEVMAQGERSSFLLSLYRSKPDAEDLVFNEEVYGSAALERRQAELANVGAAELAEIMAPPIHPRHAGRLLCSTGLPPPVPASVPNKPFESGQRIHAQILEALKPLSMEQFRTLLTNFYVGLKGKYKIPTFAHRELDLKSVWWEVIDRGGYETVCIQKAWKDVCRNLNIDLSSQTSASYNMRLNYERCLLDFENYLACGQYEADLSVGRAPVHTHLMDPTSTRFIIPGAYSYNESEWWKAMYAASGIADQKKEVEEKANVPEASKPQTTPCHGENRSDAGKENGGGNDGAYGDGNLDAPHPMDQDHVHLEKEDGNAPAMNGRDVLDSSGASGANTQEPSLEANVEDAEPKDTVDAKQVNKLMNHVEQKEKIDADHVHATT